MAVSTGTSNADTLRKSRRDQSDNPAPEDKADFIVKAIEAGDPIWITNKNGGTHTVPAEWVTEDEVGVVRVRGNGGYRFATQDEIDDSMDEQGLESDGSAKETEGHSTLEGKDLTLKVADPDEDPKAPSEANAKQKAES
jgi:hypothetical protein